MQSALQRSVNDVSNRLQNTDQKQVQICQILDDNINNTKNLKARCDEFQSALSVAAMRADRTGMIGSAGVAVCLHLCADKMLSSEIATFSTWRDQQNATTRQTDDRMGTISDDIVMIKASLDGIAITRVVLLAFQFFHNGRYFSFKAHSCQFITGSC